MQMDDIAVQFDRLVANATPKIDEYILGQMNAFGSDMVQNIIPVQRQFKNLTGNTITSFAYGIYLNGELRNMETYNGKEAIRYKVTKGEIFKGEDYDGRVRTVFEGSVETDGGLGVETSMKFLQQYEPQGKYSIVFTTGTEYSEFLESYLHLNVLSNARITAITSFVQSFKPIK